MAMRLGGRAIREIGVLFDWGAMGSWSDGQLVAQLPHGGEGREAALRVLIQRHGPMVLGICRRILGDEDAAEDALQATFLVLVRRADALRSCTILTNWIYGVALRVARKERARTVRRRVVERGAVSARSVPPDEGLEQFELRSVIDEEVGRLPERYRVPLVLCYLEGLRHEEVARRLGCPVGTVESRLSRAREQLRARLTRRGLAPTASALAMALRPPDGSASIGFSPIAERTVDAAVELLTGRAGLLARLARWWYGGRILGLGAAVQAGVVVTTLVVCAGLAARGVSVFADGAGQPRANPAAVAILTSEDEPEARQKSVTVEVEAKVRLKLEQNEAPPRPEATSKRADPEANSVPSALEKAASRANRAAALQRQEIASSLGADSTRRMTREFLKPERESFAYAPPLSGITIDGQLDDWPVAIARHPIEKLLLLGALGTGGLEDANLSTSADLSAAFSVGYDPKEQLLYLAAIVRDDKLVLGHSSHMDTDALEVYVDGLHGDRVFPHPGDVAFPILKLEDLPTQQYVAIPGKGMVYGVKQPTNPILMAGSLKKTRTHMAYSRKGDVTIYEWAIEVFDRYPDRPTKLEPGKRIGFDIAVIDRDCARDHAGRDERAEGQSHLLDLLGAGLEGHETPRCRRTRRGNPREVRGRPAGTTRTVRNHEICVCDRPTRDQASGGTDPFAAGINSSDRYRRGRLPGPD